MLPSSAPASSPAQATLAASDGFRLLSDPHKALALAAVAQNPSDRQLVGQVSGLVDDPRFRNLNDAVKTKALKVFGGKPPEARAALTARLTDAHFARRPIADQMGALQSPGLPPPKPVQGRPSMGAAHPGRTASPGGGPPPHGGPRSAAAAPSAPGPGSVLERSVLERGTPKHMDRRMIPTEREIRVEKGGGDLTKHNRLMEISQQAYQQALLAERLKNSAPAAAKKHAENARDILAAAARSGLKITGSNANIETGWFMTNMGRAAHLLQRSHPDLWNGVRASFLDWARNEGEGGVMRNLKSEWTGKGRVLEPSNVNATLLGARLQIAALDPTRREEMKGLWNRFEGFVQGYIDGSGRNGDFNRGDSFHMQMGLHSVLQTMALGRKHGLSLSGEATELVRRSVNRVAQFNEHETGSKTYDVDLWELAARTFPGGLSADVDRIIRYRESRAWTKEASLNGGFETLYRP